jgi:GTP diphosphokinase / guanosine-3',5'-bis(diphosphate) 3'-diphosphatase
MDAAMMRQYELVERVLAYDETADEALLNRAYVYAMKAHGNQKRASGDPYFSHPIEVAAILTELKLDDATIATALLHDVIEDTDTTRAEIDEMFGAEIGGLVEGLTKIKKLDLVTKKAQQAAHFRDLLVAISSDIRVLLVKLADRLHNMRTLEHKKPESRLRIAEETLEIYAPLAGRMGMQSLRGELEDLAFRWVSPEAYRTVTERLDGIRTKNKGLIEEILTALRYKLAGSGIAAQVTGREKQPFSIWRKMEQKHITLEQLSDIYGFRIIVEDADACYRALGVVHSTWRAVPGRFKDYISTPKQNGYQSLHTTIVGPRHQRVELQLRTSRMHDVAEFGVAAHALYKEMPADGPDLNGVSTGTRALDSLPAGGEIASNPYHWLRRLVATLLEGDNSEEFLEHTKLELFQDQVFCFTPKGLLIALPRGAKPIDFAYAVHTDVGNSCVGCKINGRHASLMTELRNGDEVEIVRSQAQRPPAAWESVVVTGKARSAIRRASREAVRQQFSELGRQMLAAHFGKLGQIFTDDALRSGLPRLSQRTVEEVTAAVGRGELAAAIVVRAVYPNLETPEPAKNPRRARNRFDKVPVEEGWFNLRGRMGLVFKWPGRTVATGGETASAMPQTQGIPIRGLRGDLPVEFTEGGAIPGDRIVGILSPGKAIRIYQIHSAALTEFDDRPEQWIDVRWDLDENSTERFPAHILVTGRNEPGSLAKIAQAIGEADGNIDNLRILDRGADVSEMQIDLEVWDLVHLNRIIAGLRAVPVVSKVERIFGLKGPAA